MRKLLLIMGAMLAFQASAGPSVLSKPFEIQLDGVNRLRFEIFGLDSVTYRYDKTPDGVASIMLTVAGEDDVKAAMLLVPNVNMSKLPNVTISHPLNESSCQISKKNGKIASVKGACYLKAVVTFPNGSKVELYNQGKLLNKRTIAVTIEELLQGLKDANMMTRMAVVDEYLASYKATGNVASMSADQLFEALDNFPFPEDKWNVLTKLNKTVSDRAALAAKIDSEYSAPWDKEKARKICGIS